MEIAAIEDGTGNLKVRFGLLVRWFLLVFLVGDAKVTTVLGNSVLGSSKKHTHESSTKPRIPLT